MGRERSVCLKRPSSGLRCGCSRPFGRGKPFMTQVNQSADADCRAGCQKWSSITKTISYFEAAGAERAPHSRIIHNISVFSVTASPPSSVARGQVQRLAMSPVRRGADERCRSARGCTSVRSCWRPRASASRPVDSAAD